MPPKVLLISSNSSARGGGERCLVYLARGLIELECEVHVLLSNASFMDNWADALMKEGAVLYRRHLISLSQRPFRFIQSIKDWKQIETVSSFCQELGPTAILVNQQYDEDGLDYLMGALQSRIAPVGGIMHMPMTTNKNKRPLGRFRGYRLTKWYEKYPYRLIFVSEGAQKEFETYYPSPRPTYIVNTSVPFQSGKEVSKKRTIFPIDIPVIGFVGQFVFRKNLDCLINAWLETLKKGVESKLLLVGDGPERTHVEHLLQKKAPPGSWHVTGWTAHPEDLFCEMDIFLLVSHFEGLPLSLIEAAGRAIPSVVVPFNGAKDIAKRASWVKVTSDNSISTISQTLINTLQNLQKLKEIAHIGLNDFRIFFSLRRMASEVLAVLTEERS